MTAPKAASTPPPQGGAVGGRAKPDSRRPLSDGPGGIDFNADAALPLLRLSDRRNRVFYAGLLGAVGVRTMGGWLVYASLGAPLRIALEDAPANVAAADSPWQVAQLAVVPPWVPHRVACDERLICSLTIEPETVDEAALPAWLRQHAGAVPASHPAHQQMLQRLGAAHAWLSGPGCTGDWQTACFDRALFGQVLVPRRIDPRIAGVLEAMRNDPALLSAMRHYDHTVNITWVMGHLNAARKYIDSGKGSGEATGGSDWKKYMHPKYQRRIFFPELWSEEELKNWGEGY